MTKSLLTSEDIKIFILNAIDKANKRPRCFLTRRAICKMLNVDEYYFKKWQKQKLLKPAYTVGKRNLYNINNVIKWLNDNSISYSLNKEYE